ncbi:hypothetical protein BZA70DRAFT_303112 [Myxozyma melibiosi]|uniref:Uncharacterized protein n=1 Tax=Myxozyma melibiosi TaxID=54550 RepID=A0ABR1EXV2_9ASCO
MAVELACIFFRGSAAPTFPVSLSQTITAVGKKNTRSSRASQHAAASPKHDSRPNPTHSLSLSSSQSNSVTERGSGRHPPRDRDEYYDNEARWKEHNNEFHIDRVLLFSPLPDSHKHDALKRRIRQFRLSYLQRQQSGPAGQRMNRRIESGLPFLTAYDRAF